jgi:hypothetical protein
MTSNNKNEIVLYQPDNSVKLEVRLENGTVWLTQAQIGLLFGVDRTVVTKHLKNIFTIGELFENSTCAIFAHMGNDGVDATIYTTKISTQLQLDLTRHNAQYPPIAITEKANIHDRFLLIDNDIYHIGASLKDLGKKLFAFTKMGMKAEELMEGINLIKQ